MSAAATIERKNKGATRFLTLSLGKEVYALNALRVREIIRPLPISPVPKSAKHVLGVINLRGKVIPILDLRIKFEFEFTGQTDRTCVVVVEVGANSRQVGLMVDEVREVVTLATEDIQEAPEFGGAIDAACVRGLARLKDLLVIVLDIDRMVAEAETGAVP